MGGNIEIVGQIIAGANGCGGCSGDSTKVQALALGCAQAYSGAVVSTDVPLQISSPLAFVDLPLLEQLGAIEFLFMKTTAPLLVRIDAHEAELLGIGGVFPTGFVGGETFQFEVDAFAPVNVAFLVGDQSAAQVAARINAAAMLLGYTFLPASVDTSGQLKLKGVATGAEGSIDVTGGTAQAALGFTAITNDTAEGEGRDEPIGGMFLVEFEKARAPTRIQVKGTSSQVTLMAAGPTA